LNEPGSPSAVPSLRVLRDLRELAAVREAWQTLQAHPWSDFDHYVGHVARQTEFERPHVVVLEREGRVVGLLAAQVRRESLAWRVGSLTLGHSRARVLWVGAGGAMGEADGAGAPAVVQELRAALGRGEADAAYLHQLETGSALLEAAREVRGPARDRGVRASAGWVLELPESYEAYLASRTRNVRRNLKRYSQLLERELGSDFEIVCHREPAALETLVRDSEAVARLTYHRRMRHGFEDTPEVREFFARALAAGWMRGYVLYARGKPIAFWHGLAYRGTFFTRDTGYDPAFGELRPGNYLLSKVIEEHCRTRETVRFDYGVMELEYKRQFGTRRYERASIYLFSRRPRGLALSTLRSASALADRSARKLLGSRARGWTRRLAGFGKKPAAPEEGADPGEDVPADKAGHL